MNYLLDTNIIIYACNNRGNAKESLKRHRNDKLFISSITLAELEYGVHKSSRPVQNQQALAMILSNITVVPFGSHAAVEYGDIKATLQSKGEIIGPNDLLIAAHARALNMPLVTNNVKEFERVNGIQIENWVS